MSIIVNNIVEICVAIDIAILGIAYPIIVNTISNIGEKYSSQYLQVLFNNEFPQRKITIPLIKRKSSFFQLALYATLISFIFLIFQFSPLFNWDNWFINNSAKLIVFAFTVFLVVLFFCLLNKVALYYGSSKSLLRYLIQNYNKSKPDTQIKSYNLKTINELTLYALKKQDEHLEETLLRFYDEVFVNMRKNHDKSKPLVYPVDLYSLIYKLNEVAVESKTKLREIEDRAVSGAWLLGEDFENIEISEDTYKWLWNNIYIINNDARLVKIFYNNSSSYFDKAGSINNNNKEIDKCDKEWERFLEFHYALGGLMLYKKQYQTLKHMFSFSLSRRQYRVLLFQKMTEIFKWFEYFSNEFKHEHRISFKYPFPGIPLSATGMEVNNWICRYISILFLGQEDFAVQPTLPNNILKLTNWFFILLNFQKCLNYVLSNEEVISEFGLKEKIEEKKDEINSFVPTLTTSIEKKIEKLQRNAKLSEDKIQSFYDKSITTIEQAFDECKEVFTAIIDEHSSREPNIFKLKETTSKLQFIDENDSFDGYTVVDVCFIVTEQMQPVITNSFLRAATKKYLFNTENIIDALEKIIGDNKDIIIVVNPCEVQEIISDSRFKNCMKEAHLIRLENTLFVLHKSDLPALEHKEIKEEEISTYKCEPTKEGLHLYVSVVDTRREDLQVDVNITFLSVIHWKDTRDVIQINIASQYEEQGIENDLNDIVPLSKKS